MKLFGFEEWEVRVVNMEANRGTLRLYFKVLLNVDLRNPMSPRVIRDG